MNSSRLDISTNTVGGSGYLARIVKAAQGHDHVHIFLKVGRNQRKVNRLIERQLSELHAVADVHFTYAIELCVDSLLILE